MTGTHVPARDGGAAPAADALGNALSRLARSHTALRGVFFPAPLEEGADASSTARRRRRAFLRPGPLASVARVLEPWLGSVRHSLHRWWRRHPWHGSAVLVGQAFERNALPWMQRHPIAAVSLGAVAGAALAAAAPWRWPSMRRFADDGGRRARRWALHQLGSPAAQAVLAGLVTSVLAAQGQAGPDARPAAPAAGNVA